MPDSKVPLHYRPEWSRVTLARISDAVITTDSAGRVTFLNPIAESLTGWTQAEAAGVPLEQVFQIVHPETRKAVESPTVRALREGVNAGLANRTLLIAKDGNRPAAEQSALSGANARRCAGACKEAKQKAPSFLIFEVASE